MILKHRDKELSQFEWIEPQGVRIVSVSEQKRILQIEEYGKKADDIFKVSGKSGTVNPVNGESLALKITANLKADSVLSYDELSELMGVPRRTIARRIKELADAGKICRIGAAKNGHWEVL